MAFHTAADQAVVRRKSASLITRVSRGNERLGRVLEGVRVLTELWEPQHIPPGFGRHVLKRPGVMPETGPVTGHQGREQLSRVLELRMHDLRKHSRTENHRHILEKHLLPRFGDKTMTEITRQEVQAYVAHSFSQSTSLLAILNIAAGAMLETSVEGTHTT